MAKMVHPGLFVGGGQDTYKFAGAVLHCAKDPWFVDTLKNMTRPKCFEDYGTSVVFTASVSDVLDTDATELALRKGLWAKISYNEMALNMVDAESPVYFPDEMVNAGLDFITERFAEGDPVLVHCNQGLSRGPSMAFLWMFEHGFLDDEFRYAVPKFKELYPDYCPGNGIWQYLKTRCEKQQSKTAL